MSAGKVLERRQQGVSPNLRVPLNLRGAPPQHVTSMPTAQQPRATTEQTTLAPRTPPPRARRVRLWPLLSSAPSLLSLPGRCAGRWPGRHRAEQQPQRSHTRQDTGANSEGRTTNGEERREEKRREEKRIVARANERGGGRGSVRAGARQCELAGEKREARRLDFFAARRLAKRKTGKREGGGCRTYGWKVLRDGVGMCAVFVPCRFLHATDVPFLHVLRFFAARRCPFVQCNSASPASLRSLLSVHPLSLPPFSFLRHDDQRAQG
jgi:hypothetical protein